MNESNDFCTVSTDRHAIKINYFTHKHKAIENSQNKIKNVNIICFLLELFGVIRKNWNDTEKISMAPAQG